MTPNLLHKCIKLGQKEHKGKSANLMNVTLPNITGYNKLGGQLLSLILAHLDIEIYEFYGRFEILRVLAICRH